MTTQEPCNNCGKTHPYFECDKAKPMMNEERIKADAEDYALPMVWVNQNPKGEEQLFYEYISSTSYIAGATAVHERAQELVDALEEISESNCDYESTSTAGKLHKPDCKACRAKEALEQWKGKEQPIPLNICGICKERQIGSGITVCDECYQSFDGDRRGFWDSETYH